MGRVLSPATDAERVLACNICGGVELAATYRKFAHDLVRCASCGLVFVAHPQASDGDRTDADDLSAMLEPGARAFAARCRAARRKVTVLRRTVGAAGGLRLLDIGCSRGLFLVEARRAGFSVCGVERSPVTAAFASSRFGLDVHVGDWRDAGYPDSSFDVVTLFDVVAHLRDPLGELAGLRRLLRPGGLLLQSTPNIDGVLARHSNFLARRLGCWPHPAPRHPIHHFSDRTLAELTERAGYEVTRIDQARNPFGCSCGTPRRWQDGAKWFACTALLAPVALVGPWLGLGDLLYLAARRPD
jgi:2-polyprenyl-3-methyl-5-hydroxy-6-metoxy-1,4-benzoquinol methylase